MNIAFMKKTQILLAPALTAVIFVILFRYISLTEVVRITKNCHINILLWTLVVSAGSNIYINALRFQNILRQLGIPLSLFETILIKGGGSLFKVFMPARSGEFVMMAYLKRVKDLSYIQSFFLIISEYILNLSALILFFLTGFLWSINQPAVNRHTLAMIIMFPTEENPSSRGFRAVFHKWLPDIKDNVSLFRRLCFRKTIIFYTLLYMGAEVLTFYLLAHALNIFIPFGIVLMLIPAAFLLSSLPLTLGGLGLRECAVLFLFSSYAPAEELLSLGVLYSFVENLFPLLINGSLSGLFLSRLLKGEQ